MLTGGIVRLLLCICLCGWATGSWAWGPLGHRLVAQIAESQLTPPAQAQVQAITQGQSLADLSTWPDEIRPQKKWKKAAPWHYVSVSEQQPLASRTVNKKGDILQKLAEFERRLADRQLSRQQRWQALAFYTHFVGDLHQPLHVGRAEDKGGNKITVTLMGERSNLHRVWDAGLLWQRGWREADYLTHLLRFSDTQQRQWQRGTYLDWANESRQWLTTVYNFQGKKPRLNQPYVDKNLPIAERRLQQAGLRLASQLNRLLGNKLY